MPALLTNKKTLIPSLTGVRFFLALWVLLFHSCEEWRDLPFVFAVFSKGFVAVSAFFVLSGLVLVYNYANLPLEKNAVRKFFLARFTRLYPMYFISLLIGLPLFAWYQYKTGSQFFSLTIIVFFVSALGLHSWHRAWVEKINPPSWSLSAEFFFYGIFPLINKWFQQIAAKKIAIVLATCVIINVLFMNPLVRWVEGTTFNQYIHAGVFPLLHVATFITGMCIAHLFFTHNYLKTLPNYSAFALPLLILIITVMNVPALSFININSGGYAVLFGIFFLLILDSKKGLAKFLALPFIVLLGESSYALYLLHIPVRNYLVLGLNKISPVDQYPHTFLFVYLALMIPLSIIAYLYVEKPASAYLKKKLMPLQYLPPAATFVQSRTKLVTEP